MLSKKQTKKGSHMSRTWLLQILAILGSALSMMTIGILLAHYHDQPIFDWNGLTLNAIVAVFSVISNAMLAYVLSESLGQAKWIWFSLHERPLSDINLIDSGSRGPLGSFQILTRPAARSFISMGAIIVILSITMDPFVQLTIGKRDGLKFENSTFVQISYTKRYNKELLEDTGPVVPEADLGMQSAVSEGLSQSDSWISQQTRLSCPSGNCTWDTFTSLAICSGCHDITNRIEEIKHTELYFGRSFIHKSYLLPNHLPGGDANNMWTAYGTANCTETVSFTSFDTLIWSMTIMNYTTKEERITSYNLSATECGLWYCVNSYKSTVQNGILTEIIQPAPSKKEIDSWRPLPYQSKDDHGVYTIAPKSFYATVVATNGTIPGDVFVRRRTDLQVGEGFNVSQGAFYSISNLLRDILTIPTFYFANDGAMANAVVTRPKNGGSNSYHPPAMQNLYNSQDLAATFATLAKSMTNNIRQNDDNHTAIYGKEGKYVVLIRIRGWFLILPVILIVAGAVFLAVVLHYTHRSKMEFWGTNALPIVALGEKMRPVFNDSDNNSDNNSDMRLTIMEQIAKRQLVQFPIVPRRDFDGINTLNPSVTQIPLTAVASITADVEGIASSSRNSVIPISPTDVDNTVSSSRNPVIRRPSIDENSVISSLHTSVILTPPPANLETTASSTGSISTVQSPPTDAENIVSSIRNSAIQRPIQ